jgi:hypothetical protein
MTDSRKSIAAPAEPPDVENIEIGPLVMWAGLLTSGLPCALLLVLAIISGELIKSPARYGALYRTGCGVGCGPTCWSSAW